MLKKFITAQVLKNKEKLKIFSIYHYFFLWCYFSQLVPITQHNAVKSIFMRVFFLLHIFKYFGIFVKVQKLKMIIKNAIADKRFLSHCAQNLDSSRHCRHLQQKNYISYIVVEQKMKAPMRFCHKIIAYILDQKYNIEEIIHAISHQRNDIILCIQQ